MSILVLSPHADDAELAMGAGIYDVVQLGVPVSISVVCASDYRNSREEVVRRRTRHEEAKAAAGILGAKLIFEAFDEENCLDKVSVGSIADMIEKWVKQTGATFLYVPLPWHNQDHTAVWNAVQVLMRKPRGDLTVWAYEMPGQTYPLFPCPQFGWSYEEVSADGVRKQGEALSRHKSQRLDEARGVVSIAGAYTTAGLRGQEIGLPFAERYLLVRDSRPLGAK